MGLFRFLSGSCTERRRSGFLLPIEQRQEYFGKDVYKRQVPSSAARHPPGVAVPAPSRCPWWHQHKQCRVFQHASLIPAKTLRRKTPATETAPSPCRGSAFVSGSGATNTPCIQTGSEFSPKTVKSPGLSKPGDFTIALQALPFSCSQIRDGCTKTKGTSLMAGAFFWR